MANRVFNFSAGPAVLPLPALEQAQKDLLALPGATILEVDDDGTIQRVRYDEALPVRLTRDFLAEPARYLRHLLEEET